jgi:hypothetical protein
MDRGGAQSLSLSLPLPPVASSGKLSAWRGPSLLRCCFLAVGEDSVSNDTGNSTEEDVVGSETEDESSMAMAPLSLSLLW